MSWTKFLKFDSLFEIKHYVGHPGKKGQWNTTLEGRHGFLSMADGLSPIKNSVFDYTVLNPEEIIRGVYWIRIKGNGKCEHPSKHFDYIGMAASKGNYSIFQQGIFGRIFDHYRKILLLPERSKINKYLRERFPDQSRDSIVKEFSAQNFNNYNGLRDYFTSPISGESMIARNTPKPFVNLHKTFEDQFDTLQNIQQFFSNNVYLRYSEYKASTKEREIISKGEGLALREYYNTYGDYPYLNTRDETRGLEDFDVHGDLI